MSTLSSSTGSWRSNALSPATRNEAYAISQKRYGAQVRATDALKAYRDESLFVSSDEDSDESVEPAQGWCKLGAKTWVARSSQKKETDFQKTLEAHRDELLAADRERGEALRKESLKSAIDEGLKKKTTAERERIKKEKGCQYSSLSILFLTHSSVPQRLEFRWHEHRLAEEDRIRRLAVQEQLYAQGESRSPDHSDDVYHGNFNRQWRGFEVGTIGRVNTETYESVIPQLDELLHPRYPGPRDSMDTTRDPLRAAYLPPFKPREGGDDELIQSIEQLQHDIVWYEDAQHGPLVPGSLRHIRLTKARRDMEELLVTLGKRAWSAATEKPQPPVAEPELAQNEEPTSGAEEDVGGAEQEDSPGDEDE